MCFIPCISMGRVVRIGWLISVGRNGRLVFTMESLTGLCVEFKNDVHVYLVLLFANSGPSRL